jgi:hypothetical protein
MLFESLCSLCIRILSDVSALVSVSLRVTIRTNQTEIFSFIVSRISIDVINLDRNRISHPCIVAA